MNKNKTILIKEENNKKIANVIFAESFLSRLKGLMFKKDLNHALVLKPLNENNRLTSAIHTCFMRIAIDVIFLNENREAYEIKRLKPWNFHIPRSGASYIIELKEGSIEKYKIRIGDKFDFVCEFR